MIFTDQHSSLLKNTAERLHAVLGDHPDVKSILELDTLLAEANDKLSAYVADREAISKKIDVVNEEWETLKDTIELDNIFTELLIENNVLLKNEAARLNEDLTVAKTANEIQVELKDKSIQSLQLQNIQLKEEIEELRGRAYAETTQHIEKEVIFQAEMNDQAIRLSKEVAELRHALEIFKLHDLVLAPKPEDVYAAVPMTFEGFHDVSKDQACSTDHPVICFRIDGQGCARFWTYITEEARDRDFEALQLLLKLRNDGKS